MPFFLNVETILRENQKGQFHAILMGLIFLTYIIGDLIAIPYRYLFQKDQVQVLETMTD